MYKYNTKLNLYENVRFISRKTGTFTLEITSPTLVPTSQKFAHAFTVAPAAPIPGSVSVFGQGCKGTVKSTGEACVSFNTSISFQTLRTRVSTGYALEVTAATALTVVGFDIRAQAASNQTLATALYVPNSSGVPTTVAATGTLQVTTTMGWQRTTFNKPVQIAQGGKFFVFFQNNVTPIASAFANSGTGIPYFRLTGTTWTTRIAPSFRWAFRVNCPGGFTAPVLGSTGSLDIGSRLTLTVRQAVPSTQVIFLMGGSKTTWNGLPLPWSVPGASGCRVYAAGQILVFNQTNAQGGLDLGFTVPVDKSLIGRVFYTQVAAADKQANGFGYTVSNALVILIGGTP